MPMFHNANIAVYFIKARRNLISCSSEGFPIYIFAIQGEGRGGEEQIGERERGGKNC